MGTERKVGATAAVRQSRGREGREHQILLLVSHKLENSSSPHPRGGTPAFRTRPAFPPCLPVLPIPPLRELAPSRDTPLQGEAEQSAPLDHLFYKDWSRAGGNAENCKDCYRQNPRKCQNCCHAASATSSGASHPSQCRPCRSCEALEEPALPCTVCWGQVLTGQCGPSALGRSLLDSHLRSP